MTASGSAATTDEGRNMTRREYIARKRAELLALHPCLNHRNEQYTAKR